MFHARPMWKLNSDITTQDVKAIRDLAAMDPWELNRFLSELDIVAQYLERGYPDRAERRLAAVANAAKWMSRQVEHVRFCGKRCALDVHIDQGHESKIVRINMAPFRYLALIATNHQ